jgi:hypothetical protein
VPDQSSKRLEAGRLRQGCQGQNCFFGFHISRYLDMTSQVNEIGGKVTLVLFRIYQKYRLTHSRRERIIR